MTFIFEACLFFSKNNIQHSTTRVKKSIKLWFNCQKIVNVTPSKDQKIVDTFFALSTYIVWGAHCTLGEKAIRFSFLEKHNPYDFIEKFATLTFRRVPQQVGRLCHVKM